MKMVATSNRSEKISYFCNLIFQIIRELFFKKGRSFLLMFCVAWGTFTIVILLALGEGFHDINKKDMMSIADGVFDFIPTQTSLPYHGIPSGQKVNILASDVMAVLENVPGVKAATPLLTQSANLSANGKRIKKKINGISWHFTKIRTLSLVDGSRFLNQIDEQRHSRVVVLGDKLKTSMFGPYDDPIGDTILINNIVFKVIGVVEKPSRNVHNLFDGRAIMPYTTYIDLFGNKSIFLFAAAASNIAEADKIKSDIVKFIARRCRFNSEDEKALKVFSVAEMLQFFEWFFIGIKIFLGICGFLTLSVGSIGVANVMFLSILERTRELGLRKAVGAKDFHIMFQIILESVIITFSGGIIGFVVAYLTTAFLNSCESLPNWLGEPRISSLVTCVVVVILTILGLLAGYFPAKRAVKLDPIEALRK